MWIKMKKKAPYELVLQESWDLMLWGSILEHKWKKQTFEQ